MATFKNRKSGKLVEATQYVGPVNLRKGSIPHKDKLVVWKPNATNGNLHPFVSIDGQMTVVAPGDWLFVDGSLVTGIIGDFHFQNSFEPFVADNDSQANAQPGPSEIPSREGFASRIVARYGQAMLGNHRCFWHSCYIQDVKDLFQDINEYARELASTNAKLDDALSKLSHVDEEEDED